MSKPSCKKSKAARPALDLLGGLQSGTISCESLDDAERLNCAEVLISRGSTSAEIEKILGVTDRTVRRYRNKIIERNQMNKSPELSDQIVGWAKAEMVASVQRLKRISQDRDTPHAVKVDAERAIKDAVDTFVVRLQSTGHVDSVAHRVEASVTHGIDLSAAAQLIAEEEARLSCIAGRDPELAKVSALMTAAAGRTPDSPTAVGPQGEKASDGNS
ncbi:MAG: hypothetical protein AAFR96_06715 [Planctomycetota bacterium]